MQGLSQEIPVPLCQVPLSYIVEAVQASLSALDWQEKGSSPNSCAGNQGLFQAFRQCFVFCLHAAAAFLRSVKPRPEIRFPSGSCAAFGVHRREYSAHTALKCRYVLAMCLLQWWCSHSWNYLLLALSVVRPLQASQKMCHNYMNFKLYSYSNWIS